MTVPGAPPTPESVPLQGAEAEAAPAGVRLEFRTRLISVRTMDRRLRMITGFAMALVISTAAVVAMRNVPGPSLVVGFVGSDHVSMAVPLFVFSICLLSLAWAYLIGGALHAHPVVRLVALLAVTGFFVNTFGGTKLTPAASAGVIGFGCLVYLTAAAGVLIERRRDDGWARAGLRLALVVALALEVCGVYAVLATGDQFGVSDFAGFVTGQIEVLALLLVPMLLLAGVDLTEISDVIGGAVVRGLPLGTRAAAVVMVAVAVAVSVPIMRELVDGRPVLLGLALIAVVLIAASVFRPRLPREIGTPTRVAAVAAILLACFTEGPVLAASLLPPPALVITGPDATGMATSVMFFDVPLALTDYSRTAAPAFSIRYPSIWTVTTDTDHGATGPVIVEFAGTGVKDNGYFIVASTPAGGDVATQFVGLFRPENNLCAGGCQAHLGPTPDPDGRTPVTLTVPTGSLTGHEVAFDRDGRHWWLMSFSQAAVASANAPVFSTMATTFRLGSDASAGSGVAQDTPLMADAQRRADLVAGIEEVLAIALFAGLTLAITTVARRPRRRAVAPVFILVASGMFALSAPGTLWLLVGATPPEWLPALTFDAMRLGIAVSSAIAALWLVLTRGRQATSGSRIRLLITLNVTLQLVASTIALYDGVREAGRFSASQAAIIVVALVWDIAMSGGGVTNRASDIFPRHARVLIFLGYVVMAAIAVMYFGAERIQATGGAVAVNQFASEGWIQTGLRTLGGPLAVTLFLLRWRATSVATPGPSAPPELDLTGGPTRLSRVS